MANIFISYARPDKAIAESLEKDLTSKGYHVWWDAELLGCDDFRNVISQELIAATVCIVIWSVASVDSKFVRDEASYALGEGKLIATRLRNLKLKDIPLGFRGQTAVPVSDRDKICRAINKLNSARKENAGSDVSTKEFVDRKILFLKRFSPWNRVALLLFLFVAFVILHIVAVNLAIFSEGLVRAGDYGFVMASLVSVSLISLLFISRSHVGVIHRAEIFVYLLLISGSLY